MLVISLTLVIGLVINVSNQNQVEAEDESIPTDDSFFVINEDGEIEFIDPTEEDMKQIKEENENQEYKVVVNDGEMKKSLLSMTIMLMLKIHLIKLLIKKF